MAVFKTVAELINAVENNGVTEVYLNLPDDIKHDPIRNTAEIKALAEFLKTNTSITELELGGNNIGAAGAAVIAKALKTNTSIKELHLHDNNIDEVGANDMAEALKTNTSITELYLHDNNIDDAMLSKIDKTTDNNIELNHPKNIAHQRGICEGIVEQAGRTHNINFPNEVLDHISSFIGDTNKLKLEHNEEVCQLASERGAVMVVQWAGKELAKEDEADVSYADKELARRILQANANGDKVNLRV